MVKQDKTRFSQTNVFSLLVYASPLWLSPLMNVHEVEFLPLRICMSHMEMTIHSSILSSILSPFLSRIDKTIKRNEGKKRIYDKDKKKMHEGCKMNEKIKLKHKAKTSKKKKCYKALRTWHAKDDGTWSKPRHDIDTRTC